MKRILHSVIVCLAMLVATRTANASDLAIVCDFPTNGAVLTAPLSLHATATESSNSVVSAEFFANGQSIGVVRSGILYPANPYPGTGLIITTVFRGPIGPETVSVVAPFSLFWNPQPGDYVLTALATDDHGNTAISDPINITVIPTPVVSVDAIASVASPAGPGIFTISRTGFTNADLTVQYFINGNAQSGIDYAPLSNSVTIPAGQISSDVVVTPLAYQPGKSRAVILSLSGFAVPLVTTDSMIVPYNPPYLVGSPANAAIYIKANERDPHKPAVKITQPKLGHQSLPAGSDITIVADTMDRDTYVALVEFFDGTTKLGETPAVTTTSPGQHIPFIFTWTNAPVGTHALHARATDSQGKTQISPPVRVKVSPVP